MTPKSFLPGFTAACLFFFSSVNLQAEPPKTMVFGIPGDPKTFNLLVSQDSTSSEIGRFLFEGLTVMDPHSGEIKGRLAERWEVSPDGLRWTFYLRPGVRWSDGTPFSSRDVVFTFQTMANPAFVIPARDIFTLNGKWLEVNSIDDLTVEFVLPEPFAPFLLAMGQPVFPQHRLAEAVESGQFMKVWGIDANLDAIVGTGPFRIHRYFPGEKIELVKNPFYWKLDEKGAQLPKIERIFLLIISSPEVRLLKFMEGTLDVYSLSGRDYPLLKPLSEKKNFLIYQSGLGLGSNFLVFNQAAQNEIQREWFRSVSFRQAVAYAIDRQSLVEIILNRLGGVQCSPVSPSIPHYYHSGVFCYDFNPAQSRKLLEQEGFQDRNQDGFLEDSANRPLEFVLATNSENPERVEMAQMIREDLLRVGIKAHLLVLEFNSLVSRLLGPKKDWDAVLIGFTGTADPHFGANVWKSSGSLHFWESKDPQALSEGQKRINEIFLQASALMDPAARKVLYDEWQEIVAREVPLIYTVLPETMVAVRDRFTNLRPSVLGGVFHNIEEIDVKA